MDDVITLSTQLTTQVRLTQAFTRGEAPSGPHTAYVPVIAGHGLGPKNPKTKSHVGDTWVSLLNDTVAAVEMGLRPPCISYTARGHGESRGWEDTAESDPTQFTWRALSGDMVAVADHYDVRRFVAAGSSMGGATALFAAALHPDRVAGLVMIRPPTAWAERLARRKFLLSSAAKCAEEMASTGERYHFVLQGAALSDLPDPAAAQGNEYAAIRCPVLLLTIEGDESHPVSTATTLHALLPQSSLHVAPTAEAAVAAWPAIVRDFLAVVHAQEHVA
jgi:hypothetical protein